MGKKTGINLAESNIAPEKAILEAEPSPLKMDRRRTGIIIVDMQNAFLAKGAFTDLTGGDITPCRAIIEPIRKICRAARSIGCKVVYIFTIHHPGDAGIGPDSVYWHKENSLVLYREHPEYKERLLLPNTWGAKIIDELSPQEDDILVEKPRYSGFFDTNLDTVLKRYNIRYLLTTGVATNNCVEATIRDAYYRGYFPILVSDAAATSGPVFVHEATIFNVKRAYGWVTTTDNVVTALSR